MRARILNNERGSLLVFFSVTLAFLFACVALVADMGNAMKESRKIQAGSDAAAYAAANIVSDPSYSDTEVVDHAKQYAESNGIDLDNELYGLIQVGNYDLENKVFVADHADRNAIRFPTTRNVDSWVAPLMGVEEVNTKAYTIAVGPTVLGNCVKPFGFSNQVLGIFTPGTVVTIGSESSGNWGKIDVGGNMSSGNNFEDAMYQDTCETTVNVGSEFSPGTGFGGPIKTIFETLYNNGDVDMTLMVVDGFPNGNNGVVTVEKFADATLVSVSDLGGQSWSADIRINALLDEIPVEYEDGSVRKIVE